VELREADSAINNFHFAQVDCAANGDLCHAHEVKYYPSIFLYVDGELYDEYSGKRTIEALSAYVDENMPGKVVWLDEDGKPEVKGGAVKSEENKADDKKAARPVVPLKGAAEAAVAGGALHVAAGEDDSTAAPFDVILDDASPATHASTSSATDAERSTSAEQPPVPAFVTQIRKMNFEEKEKRNESNAPRPDGVVHVLKAEEVAGLKDAESRPSFVKFYAPW
jgi:protein disulfide-isomerase